MEDKEKIRRGFKLPTDFCMIEFRVQPLLRLNPRRARGTEKYASIEVAPLAQNYGSSDFQPANFRRVRIR